MRLSENEAARLRMKAKRDELTVQERDRFFEHLQSEQVAAGYSRPAVDARLGDFDRAWLYAERKRRAGAAGYIGNRTTSAIDGGRDRRPVLPKSGMSADRRRRIEDERASLERRRLEKEAEKEARIREEARLREEELSRRWWGKMEGIAPIDKVYTPESFLHTREGYKGHLQDFDFMGCYVIHNLTRDIYYVGQAKHVTNRVYAHFTGRGNGDVYADYKYDNEFEMLLVDIMDTEYRRLDDLERDLIDAFDAYNRGYNKTRGNR